MAEVIIQEAEKVHQGTAKNSERTQIQTKVSTLNSQIEVLSERLADLPRGISAEPIYRQMERLQELKREEENRLARVGGPSYHDKPIRQRTGRPNADK